MIDAVIIRTKGLVSQIISRQIERRLQKHFLINLTEKLMSLSQFVRKVLIFLFIQTQTACVRLHQSRIDSGTI